MLTKIDTSETLKGVLLLVSEKHGVSVVQALSDLINDCMMSKDDEPLHVNGIELLCLIDKKHFGNKDERTI